MYLYCVSIDATDAVSSCCPSALCVPLVCAYVQTFHFAGVASMNITQGVPRIKEIINASKTISTPIVTVYLEDDKSIKAARTVKGRIEKTTLKKVAKNISKRSNHNKAYISILLDEKLISSHHLEITADDVAEAILATNKLKLKHQHVLVMGEWELVVFPANTDTAKLTEYIHTLFVALPQVVVKGIPTVERAVIHEEGSKYKLLVEGSSLQAVMVTEGVKGSETDCNHIIEVARVLGIEAARQRIISEILLTMREHGMNIDPRHAMLLADLMTCKGEVLGTTRFGMIKMKDSVLMHASFERTTDVLFDAAIHGREDHISGVSECIILGVPMRIGTGLFSLRCDPPAGEPLRDEPTLTSPIFQNVNVCDDIDIDLDL